MTGCTRAGDLAGWWHGTVGGAEKLVALERWQQFCVGSSLQAAERFRSLRYNSLSVTHVSQKGEYLHEW